MQEKDKIPVGKAKDISGQKYGRLTVLYRVAPPANITSNETCNRTEDLPIFLLFPTITTVPPSARTDHRATNHQAE